ncbi:MAG: cytochrome c-type biogenesis protein CcmH [Chloroflexi bacterium]|nr:cytochrome c-type biogenesis protein CcmH [Chloroflexota bacterium]MCC6895786.1 cytochrome c-type biogenesis protein CcmH [Anaerolineae bacterium]
MPRLSSWTKVWYLVGILAAALMIYPTAAQDATPATVTADDINAVAKEMYCPVCENIPLDVCPTDACQQWREEIGAQLAAGQTPEQIKASFVERYGDRVVGTPDDPMLRALSLATPPAIALVAILIALWVIIRWRRNHNPARALASPTAAPIADDDYRARLENDLRSRR